MFPSSTSKEFLKMPPCCICVFMDISVMFLAVLILIGFEIESQQEVDGWTAYDSGSGFRFGRRS